MTITIRQIGAEDWRQFRAIRLRALQTDPQAFGSHFAREKVYSPAKWKEWAGDTHQGLFLIYDDKKVIGMTGIYVPQDTVARSKAVLWGSWLDPAYRRRGISDLMYKKRIAWAKRQTGLRKIEVSHRASNLASKYANQKHGFKLVREENKQWHDGITEDDVIYELKVD